ncbi:MAG: hypothetical protein KDA75_15180, partial [Planctomycetaceae bacterium]|nr:hypothetical protein [Planctomycetaceae bacterium]
MPVHAELALVWQPIASPLKIGLGATLLAALAMWAYLRVLRTHPRSSACLLLMRLAVIAVVTALLCGPSRELPSSPQRDRPRLTILVDTSESMLTEDCSAESRLDYVASSVLSPMQLSLLREEFDIELFGFGEAPAPLAMGRFQASPESLATAKVTRLSDAVVRTISRLNGADGGDLLLVVSDGRDREDAPVLPAAELAATKGVPIFTVGVGGDRSETDAALLAIPMQDALLPGEPGGIQLKIYQSGLSGATATAKLTGGGDVQRVSLQFGDAQLIEAQLTVEQDQPGQYEYQVSLDPLEGEAELGNNSQTVFVNVMARRIRILLLEGEPFWDTKFLAQSLRKDEQVELTQVTQIGDQKQETIVTRREGGTPQVPQSADDWRAYDIVILGHGLDRLLDQKSAVSLLEFVRDEGGHVVFSRGPAWDRTTPNGSKLDDALNVLEPVVWGDLVQQDLSLELTPSGRTAAWFATTKMGADVETALARLPGFERLTSVEREKSGALVLARAVGSGGPDTDGLPAIARMSYGRGQIVAILGEGLWRWGLLPPDLQDLRGFYDVFWSNLIRWLALGGDFEPGREVSLQLSRTSARLGDELTLDVLYRQVPPAGADPRLEIRGPDDAPLDVALHPLPGQTPRFRATLTPTQTGVHRVTVQTPGMSPAILEKRFNVYEVNL